MRFRLRFRGRERGKVGPAVEKIGGRDGGPPPTKVVEDVGQRLICRGKVTLMD